VILNFCLLFLTLFTGVNGNDLNAFNTHFKLLPQPQKIELLSGEGLEYSDLRAICMDNASKPVMSEKLACLPVSDKKGAGTVSLIINPKLILPSSEGYRLEITKRQVVIEALSQAGLFYGLQTLDQLLEDSHDLHIKIPSCRITDFPEIAYRAVHLDLKHHIDAIHSYYDIIDRLAKIKINAIIVEFEDKLRYRKAPLVGAANSISIEEFAAISKYALKRNIEISPLVQGLGHASFILKHEEYKDLRDDPSSDWVFDPLNPKTYELQFALYEDAIKATPYGRYLHVGGDEVGVGNLGKSELSKKSGKSAFELQMYWLTKVSKFAEEHHRIPIFWDDMVFNYAGLYRTTNDPNIKEEDVKALWNKNKSILDQNIPLFPKNCVYMRWSYNAPKLIGNQYAIDWFNEHKLVNMAATAAQQAAPLLPLNGSNFQAIKDFCQLTTEKKMSGILCTIWEDASPHFETVWRGLYDFSQFSWNYEDIEQETTHTIFRHRFYSPEMEPASFNFQDLLEKGVNFWSRAFLTEGNRYKYNNNLNYIDLPDPGKSKEWELKYKDKVAKAEDAVSQYEQIKEQLDKAKAIARRNNYSLEVFDQINRLQVYSSRLLLLLRKYDVASLKDKNEIGLQIRKFINDFAELRSDYETVYSETRILGNPEGYQLDSNFHHHLANGTNDTDWMFMCELAMNKKVAEWLSQNNTLTNK
jgi:hexosaminidase